VTFIVIEGGEGSGKSTQVERVARWLRGRSDDVVATFEPGDTKVGAQIRNVLLHGETALDPHAELLLLLADRAQHVAEVIRPALKRGAIVVSDRFTPSTLAYQGVARGLGVDAVESWNALACGEVEPDVVVVLDVPDAIAESRVTRERDRVEQEGETFHARVRTAYRDLAKSRGWFVVDGTGAPGEVEVRVRAVVARLFS
jgi:dTMP kinase